MGQANGYWRITGTFSDVNNAGSYGSPADPFGAGAVGLDQAGRPLYVGMKYQRRNYVGFGSGDRNALPYD